MNFCSYRPALDVNENFKASTYGSMVILMVVMFLSLCLLSAAFTDGTEDPMLEHEISQIFIIQI